MASDPFSGERINLFSLVTYLPDPLAGFIDRLRGELVPGCCLRAHVTLLPPRSLSEPAEEVGERIRGALLNFKPFQVRLERVEIFTMTSVVHLCLGRGLENLVELHDALNATACTFREPFEYHPHVTLAQGIVEEQVPAVFEHARHRWAQYPHQRSFWVDRAAFVQAINLYNWVDLAEYPLSPQPGP
jgi:2'-5' RNA ligase